jgi:hypothetical protein
MLKIIVRRVKSVYISSFYPQKVIVKIYVCTKDNTSKCTYYKDNKIKAFFKIKCGSRLHTCQSHFNSIYKSDKPAEIKFVEILEREVPIIEIKKNKK